MISFDPPLTQCPLCGHHKISRIHSINYKAADLYIFACSRCGFQFMNPAPDDGSVSSMYTDGYYSGNAEYTYHDERKTEKYSSYVWKARLQTIRRWAESGNFLDIGCSFGGFLKQASDYFSPFGIEISKYAADYAANRGITVHTGSITDDPFENGYFSVITMIEVIEHLQDPRQAASYCYRKLKQGGIAVIQTADMNAYQARKAGQSYHYYLPGHLSYYSENNLKQLLYDTGFSRIKVYRPVDFGLIPKLRKMRGDFTKMTDYFRWLKTAVYHYRGHLRCKGVPLTSSMVVYAQK